MTEAVCGIDSSTQSTKLEVRELSSGKLLFYDSIPHPPTSPPKSEQDPTIWINATLNLLQKAASIDALKIVGINVSAQQHGLVVMDKHDKVIRDAKLWNDTESHQQARTLIELLGGSHDCYLACANVYNSSFTASKILWLKENEPEVFASAAKICLPHDYITFKLSGEFVTDRGDASGTGYFNPFSDSYNQEVLNILGVHNIKMPTINVWNRVVGYYNGIPVYPGTGDNMASAAAIALNKDTVAISIGTSGAIFTQLEGLPEKQPPEEVNIFCAADSGYLALACTLNATKVVNKMAELFGVELDFFSKLGAHLPESNNRLIILPFFDGERTPLLPQAYGVVLGLRSFTTKQHLAESTFRSVAFSIASALTTLTQALDIKNHYKIVLIGGGADFEPFKEIFPSLFSLPVYCCDLKSPPATGACVLATAGITGTTPEDIVEQWKLNRSMEKLHPKIDRDNLMESFQQYSQYLNTLKHNIF
jgi:xylulokinase